MSEMPIMDPEVTDWSILLGWRGSYAHGMAEEGSDKDLISVTVPPISYYMGLETMGNQGSKEFKRDEWDVVAHEPRKFVRMLIKGSVDAMTLLWLPASGFLQMTQAGMMLIQDREKFLSRKMLMRMGDGFVLNHLNKHSLMTDPGVRRGTYTCKDAMMNVRSLEFLIPALAYAHVEVGAADPSVLLDIKHGKWSIEAIHARVLALKAQLQAAYIKSPLPEEVDQAWASDLCCRVINQAWDERKANSGR